MLSSIKYPKEYQDEASRTGKKFKYYKVEPVDIENKKEEKPKEIKIGETSGRLSTLENWRNNPQQGNINYLKEDILCESFSDLIDDYLEELRLEGYAVEATEGSSEENSDQY